LEDLIGLQSGLPTLPLEQRRGAEGCKPSLPTDEDMKQSFQFRTYPGTNFAGKPRYPTSFRLGHLPTIHHYLEASSNDEVMRSSELKDARTVATGHRETSYDQG